MGSFHSSFQELMNGIKNLVQINIKSSDDSKSQETDLKSLATLVKKLSAELQMGSLKSIDLVETIEERLHCFGNDNSVEPLNS